jgi:hypothetical protein
MRSEIARGTVVCAPKSEWNLAGVLSSDLCGKISHPARRAGLSAAAALSLGLNQLLSRRLQAPHQNRRGSSHQFITQLRLNVAPFP